ncbi:MAG: fibronectin type III domain-containing protein [Muribaculaceae bacterium]
MPRLFRYIIAIIAVCCLCGAVSACHSDPPEAPDDRPGGNPSGGDDDDSDEPTPQQLDFAALAAQADGVVSLTDAAGCDAVWVCPQAIITLVALAGDDASDTYSHCLTVSDLTASHHTHVICRRDGKPAEVRSGANVLYLNAYSHGVTDIVRVDESNGSVYYDYAADPVHDECSEIGRTDFRALLGYLAQMFGATGYGMAYDLFATLSRLFEAVAIMPDAPPSATVDAIRSAPALGGLIAKVRASAGSAVQSSREQLLIWSSSEPVSVAADEAVLAAMVMCGSSAFNALGVYAIECDTDIGALEGGRAAFRGSGVQEGVGSEFKVTIEGLRPNTTYYYRAVYTFGSTSHSPLAFVCGSADGVSLGETSIKRFKTPMQ